MSKEFGFSGDPMFVAAADRDPMWVGASRLDLDDIPSFEIWSSLFAGEPLIVWAFHGPAGDGSGGGCGAMAIGEER
ncbi:hypothetical protein L484_025369 [Morus notabilis]|uniref:Uncharacterized protein n=1 Tax=Morus notabilis TaxID=981085 RepID=W9RCS9_9ROSA|nr:hypothetical protein L484_025369 [Morus notabilis]